MDANNKYPNRETGFFQSDSSPVDAGDMNPLDSEESFEEFPIAVSETLDVPLERDEEDEEILPTTIDEEEAILLLAQTKKGDLDAFSRLLMADFRRLCIIAYNRTKNRGYAEDVAMDVILTFIEHAIDKPWYAARFVSPEHLRGALSLSVVRRCIDRSRSKAAHVILRPMFDDEGEVAIRSQSGVSTEDPANLVVSTVDLERGLDRTGRLLLRVAIEDVPAEKAAEILAIPLGTVKSRVSTLKTKLAKAIVAGQIDLGSDGLKRAKERVDHDEELHQETLRRVAARKKAQSQAADAPSDSTASQSR
jgi:DNA-directed RNA polymerase specialized sigma24 family protein